MIDCTENLVQPVWLTLDAMDMRQFVWLYVYLLEGKSSVKLVSVGSH